MDSDIPFMVAAMAAHSGRASENLDLNSRPLWMVSYYLVLAESL